MIHLPATLTHAQAESCLSELRAQMGAGEGDFELDAAGLQAFDSSALAVLLACRRHAQASGREFSVLRMPERLRSLAHVYGVLDLLGH